MRKSPLRRKRKPKSKSKQKPTGHTDYKIFIRSIFERDGWQCKNPLCGSYHNLTNHHIKKRSLGGKHDPGNCVTICAECHMHNEAGRLKITRGIDQPDGCFPVVFADGRYGITKSASVKIT